MTIHAGRHPPRSIEGTPMFRKIRDGFTATHFTILALGAMFVPSTLYAVVSYQPVAIVNANTGYKASVDTNGRLFTYSPLTDNLIVNSNTPAAYVNISANTFTTAGGSACNKIYTPPSGKALIVSAATIFLSGIASGNTGSSVVATDSACTQIVAGGITNLVSDQRSQFFGVQGVPVPAGSSLYLASFQADATVQITGYLVPASAVPAQPTQVAAPMGRSRLSR